MLNRRKAAIGYLVYTAGKPLAKRAIKTKARAAVPGTQPGSRLPNVPAIVAALGAAAGVLLFWRKRKGGSDDTLPS